MYTYKVTSGRSVYYPAFPCSPVHRQCKLMAVSPLNSGPVFTCTQTKIPQGGQSTNQRSRVHMYTYKVTSGRSVHYPAFPCSHVHRQCKLMAVSPLNSVPVFTCTQTKLPQGGQCTYQSSRDHHYTDKVTSGRSVY